MTIGEASCVGDYACYYSADDGISTLGENCCNGHFACYHLGHESLSTTIGDNACNGYAPCHMLGEMADFITISSDVCNYDYDGLPCNEVTCRRRLDDDYPCFECGADAEGATLEVTSEEICNVF